MQRGDVRCRCEGEALFFFNYLFLYQVILHLYLYLSCNWGLLLSFGGDLVEFTEYQEVVGGSGGSKVDKVSKGLVEYLVRSELLASAIRLCRRAEVRFSWISLADTLVNINELPHPRKCTCEEVMLQNFCHGFTLS